MELPLLKDHPDAPWPGFDDATDGRTHWPRARDLADYAAPGSTVAKLTRGDQTYDGPSGVGESFLRPGDPLPDISNPRLPDP